MCQNANYNGRLVYFCSSFMRPYPHAIFLGVTEFKNDWFLDKKENLYYCFTGFNLSGNYFSKQVNVRMFDFLKIREKCRDSLIYSYIRNSWKFFISCSNHKNKVDSCTVFFRNEIINYFLSKHFDKNKLIVIKKTW